MVPVSGISLNGFPLSSRPSPISFFFFTFSNSILIPRSVKWWWLRCAHSWCCCTTYFLDQVESYWNSNTGQLCSNSFTIMFFCRLWDKCSSCLSTFWKSFFCFAVNKWITRTSFCRASKGTINGPVCIPPPEIVLNIWEGPSDANLARVGRPNVFPIVGSNVLPTDKIDDESDPPTWFLIFVFVSFVSIPLRSCRFLFNLSNCFWYI